MSVLKKAALLTLLSLWSPALAGDLIGQASIIDGDTLEIHGTRIRLWGIDAPESSQLCRDEDSSVYRCGARAANDLDAFLAGRPVTCPTLISPTTSAAASITSLSTNNFPCDNFIARRMPPTVIVIGLHTAGAGAVQQASVRCPQIRSPFAEKRTRGR